jgi:hypothetical protein
MSRLPDRIEIEIARARIRDAVRAFSRSPTEANQHRVSAAMRMWRELKESRGNARAQPNPSARYPKIPA